MTKRALCILQRGEELIAASFSEVVARLKAPLDACLEAAGQSKAVRILPGSFSKCTPSQLSHRSCVLCLVRMLVLL